MFNVDLEQMIYVAEIYDDAKDTIATDQNGELSFPMFNRLSRRSELSVIDWLTGNSDVIPRPPFQKNKDIISIFLGKSAQQVTAGVITKPDDYYTYDNFYRIGSKVQADCDTDEVQEACNTAIEILEGSKYNVRCRTYIDEKKPSFSKPIAKIIGTTLELTPNDLGSVVLEYYRNPVFAKVVSKLDTVYNEEIVDPALSTNYEWPEAARPVLIWFIVNAFADHTREQALKTFNAASKP